jgi:hypothetical protein
MAGYEGTPHRCPDCGAGANWTSLLQADDENGSWRLLICAECGAFLGEERAWHGLGPGQDDVEDADTPLRRWLQMYHKTR